jgi:hypothetical protein
MNNITIDIESIRKMPNESITDSETIRQIALYSIQNPEDKELVYKVKTSMAFAGLYPHIQQPINIQPDNSKEYSSILDEIYLKRNK